MSTQETTPCKRCKRSGLAILPVMYSVLPKEVIGAFPKPVKGGPSFGGDIGSLPGSTVTPPPLFTETYAGFPRPFKGGEAVFDKPVGESGFVLRTLDPGYIYLLYPGKVWRGYTVDVAGYLAYYPDLLMEDMPASLAEASNVEACEQQGKAHHGVEALCIESPESLKGPVYIAYSRHRWTKEVRAHYAFNPSQRMQVVAALDGSAFPDAEVVSTDTLPRHVVDYNGAAVITANKYLDRGVHLRDRSPKAAPLIKAMQAMSGTLNKPGLIMALWDPVGITARLNDFRNRIVQRVTAIDADTTDDDRSDFLVAATLRDLRASLEKSEDGWERFQKWVDQPKLDRAIRDIDARQKLAERIEKLSTDYVAWMTSPQLLSLFQFDFDSTTPASGYSLEDSFHICTVGSGVTPLEREKVWQPWFDLPPDDQRNVLWRAALANDTTASKFLSAGRLDKLFDFHKTGKDVFKEAAWFAYIHDVINAGRQRFAMRRQYRETTARISTTIAGQLQWLYHQDHNHQRFFKAAGKMAALLAHRGDIVVLPHTITGKVGHYVRRLYDTHLGGSKAFKPLVQAAATLGIHSPKRVDPSDLANAEARAALAGVPLQVDIGGSAEKIRKFTDWVVLQLDPGRAPDAQMHSVLSQLRLSGGDMTLGSQFTINPLTDQTREAQVAKFDRGWSFGTGLMQLFAFTYNFNELMKEMKKDSPDDLAVQSGFATLGTVCMSAIAVRMEIAAASHLVAQSGVQTLKYRWLSGGAGGLGIIAGGIDSYYLWLQSEKLKNAGEENAAKLTLWSAGLTGTSALLIGGTSIAMAFGATGIGIPIALVIGLVTAIAAMAASFLAAKAMANDLEKWLDRCRFGLRKLEASSKGRFKTLEDEFTGLRLVMYAVRLESDRAILGEGSRFTYKVTVPFYAKASEFEMAVIGVSGGGQERVIKSLKFADGAQQPAVTGEPKLIVRDKLDQQIQGKTLALEGVVVVLDEPRPAGAALPPAGLRMPDVPGQSGPQARRHFTKVKLRVVYKPDIQTWPELVIEAAA